MSTYFTCEDIQFKTEEGQPKERTSTVVATERNEEDGSIHGVLTYIMRETMNGDTRMFCVTESEASYAQPGGGAITLQELTDKTHCAELAVYRGVRQNDFKTKVYSSPVITEQAVKDASSNLQYKDSSTYSKAYRLNHLATVTQLAQESNLAGLVFRTTNIHQDGVEVGVGKAEVTTGTKRLLRK